MRHCLLLAVLLCGFAPAPLPRPERRPSPQNPILGLWVGNVQTSTGASLARDQQLLVTPDRMIYVPGPNSREYVMRLDVSRRPATYHLQGVRGGGADGREGRGIWRVEGDVLTITYNSIDEPLPAGFDGGKEGSIVEVYRRLRR